jgi:hypothetical protein
MDLLMNKKLILLLLTLLITSCGSKEEKREDAILRANIALTRGNCQEAIDILELQGRDSKNDKFTKTLASAYACRANYKTTVLFATDLPKITDPSILFREISTFTSSPNDASDNPDFTDLQIALDLILYSGGTSTSQNPSSEERRAIFGDKGKDINAFGFYLSIAQLGKFIYYYGNSSPTTGVKGGGVHSNPCYLDYNANVDAFITAIIGGGGSTGTCAAGSNSGHPDLVDGADTVNLVNACHGIVLFNNFYDTLQSFITAASDDFDEFIGLDLVIEALKLAITTAKPTFDTRIFDTTSQERCESLFAGNDEDIMYFYAGIYETLHR